MAHNQRGQMRLNFGAKLLKLTPTTNKSVQLQMKSHNKPQQPPKSGTRTLKGGYNFKIMVVKKQP